MPRDRALAAEQIERHARIGAVRDRPERLLDIGGIDVAGDGLSAVDLAIDAAAIPFPVVTEELEVAAQRRAAAIRATVCAECRWPASTRRRATKLCLAGASTAMPADSVPNGRAALSREARCHSDLHR